MISHPEGGHYVEVLKNEHVSQIYYLLKENEKSHWHKIKKNEILHFYLGDPLEVFTSADGVDYDLFCLGSKNNYIYTVLSNTWFAMRSTGTFSLIGCTVAPHLNLMILRSLQKIGNHLNLICSFKILIRSLR